MLVVLAQQPQPRSVSTAAAARLRGRVADVDPVLGLGIHELAVDQQLDGGLWGGAAGREGRARARSGAVAQAAAAPKPRRCTGASAEPGAAPAAVQRTVASVTRPRDPRSARPRGHERLSTAEAMAAPGSGSGGDQGLAWVRPAAPQAHRHAPRPPCIKELTLATCWPAGSKPGPSARKQLLQPAHWHCSIRRRPQARADRPQCVPTPACSAAAAARWAEWWQCVAAGAPGCAAAGGLTAGAFPLGRRRRRCLRTAAGSRPPRLLFRKSHPCTQEHRFLRAVELAANSTAVTSDGRGGQQAAPPVRVSRGSRGSQAGWTSCERWTGGAW